MWWKSHRIWWPIDCKWLRTSGIKNLENDVSKKKIKISDVNLVLGKMSLIQLWSKSMEIIKCHCYQPYSQRSEEEIITSVKSNSRDFI